MPKCLEFRRVLFRSSLIPECVSPHRDRVPSGPRRGCAPKGSLDGWARCKTMPVEGMAANRYKITRSETILKAELSTLPRHIDPGAVRHMFKDEPTVVRVQTAPKGDKRSCTMYSIPESTALRIYLCHTGAVGDDAAPADGNAGPAVDRVPKRVRRCDSRAEGDAGDPESEHGANAVSIQPRQKVSFLREDDMSRRRGQRKGWLRPEHGVWLLTYRVYDQTGKGQRETVTIGPCEGSGKLTEKQAERFAWDHYLAKVDQIAQHPRSLMTIAEFWEKHYKPAALLKLKKTSRDQYFSLYAQWIEPVIGRKSVV